MIHFNDPFGQETIVTVLPIDFNDTVQFSVNSKYKYIAVWDLRTAKQVYDELGKAILKIEEKK